MFWDISETLANADGRIFEQVNTNHTFFKRIWIFTKRKWWNNHKVTLQATSIFTGLPPKSVGRELDCEDLEQGELVCGALEDVPLSQRCRKRVTSSWSSIVFMCLKNVQVEKLKLVNLRSICFKWVWRFIHKPWHITWWHCLPERTNSWFSPPSTSTLLLLQVCPQVLFSSDQPALHKVRSWRTF